MLVEQWAWRDRSYNDSSRSVAASV